MADALPWFPAAGALLGWLLWIVAWGLVHLPGLWNQGIAFFILLGGVFLTRGFHLDGLADCADGLGGGHSRGKRLAIMKDSHIGVFGVAAVTLLLLGKWICLTRLTTVGELLWLPTAWIISRTIPVALAFFLPYAREDGTGAEFVRNCKGSHLGAALALGSLLIFFGGGPLHLTAWVPAAIFALLWGYYVWRRLGGVTGDVLGAAVETSETLILAMGCLL
jgi:adenosylcobinamide-GDP ribazoletransferase